MTEEQTSDPYSPKNIALYEAIFGKHLISLGGSAAIDNMFTGINLTGLKALDLGFGLGGVAYYLASKYQIEIAGVEIHPWMAEYAGNHSPESVAHLLTFSVYTAQGKIPFAKESFDLVYSKGVLNHVRDKPTLFRQVYSVLKPNGLFIIADWIYPNIKPDDGGPLVYETKESYQEVLQESKFEQIEFRDDSSLFYSYVQSLLDNLLKQHAYIEKEFGGEIFTIIKNDYQTLLEDIAHKRKFAVRIVARKAF